MNKLILTTKEMVNYFYENNESVFECVRDDFSNDIGKRVWITRKILCWEGNKNDSFKVVPEENNEIVLFEKIGERKDFDFIDKYSGEKLTTK